MNNTIANRLHRKFRSLNDLQNIAKIKSIRTIVFDDRLQLIHVFKDGSCLRFVFCTDSIQPLLAYTEIE